MKLAYKIGYGIFITAVIIIAGLLALTIFPIQNNFQVKIVQSGSMEPAIKTGSIVVVKPQKTYAAGNIITFGKDTVDEVPITHRILESRAINGKIFYTVKGDANNAPDPREVSHEEVIGKVIFDVPYLGFVIDFARTPIGFVLIIGVPAAVVVFDELATIYKESKALIHRRRERVEKKDEPSSKK